ncbi:MAG: hypothetical protein RL688_310 [Actinomycetota bacterium]
MKKFLTISFVGALIMIGGRGSSNVSAAAPTGKVPAKVTICHRTNSVTNPYTRITVDQDAIGTSRSKHGSGAHDDWATSLYGSKPVPNVFNPSKTYPSNDKNWGDIIPDVDVNGNPFTGSGAGLNYSGIGIAIYNGTGIYAGLCGDSDTTTTTTTSPGDPGETGDTTTTSPEVSATRKLKGKIWVDSNRDGRKDSNERIMKDFRITVSPGPGNTETETFTVETDENGDYEIADLPPGNWIVRPASIPSEDYEAVSDTDSDLEDSDWVVSASVPDEGEATADFSLALTALAVEEGVPESIGAAPPVVEDTLPETGSNTLETLLFVTSLTLLGWFLVRVARRQDLGING